MKTWRCGRSATLIASMARCGSPSRQRASAATAIPPLRLLGDPPDRLEVAGRGGREAGLDDVDLEAGELAGDLELLGGGQAGAGRLLAVAQGRVEDADACPAATNGPAGRGTGRRAHRRGSRRRRGGLGLAGLDHDRVEERHLGAQLGADLLDLVVAVGRPQPLELVPAGSFSAIQRLGERAVLDLARGPACIVSRTCSSMIRGPLT